MAGKRKELSDEELAERKRQRCEAARIRRAKRTANETPEARQKRLLRLRGWSYTEGARLRYREYRRVRCEKDSQTDKDLWSAHRRRQHRLELWRLLKETNPRKRPARERLMMISQFEKPCSRFQERVGSAVVVEVLCGLCQRLCPDSDVQWANEGQSALLARVFSGEDVTLLRLCSKCRRSLNDNKVPLLARRSPTAGALVTVHSPLKQVSE